VRYGGGEVHAKTCEFGTYARIGEVKSLCFNKYEGLETRPNIAHLPGVTTYYLYDGEKKNSTEKPVSLATHWLGYVGTVGSTVFLPCAGTGSEVLAALKLKRNVVAVEKDKEQWNAILQRVSEHEKKETPRPTKKTTPDSSSSSNPTAPPASGEKPAELPLVNCAVCKVEIEDRNDVDVCLSCQAFVHAHAEPNACRHFCAACGPDKIFCSAACHKTSEPSHAPPADVVPDTQPTA
jgi:hypothetical protein